MKKITFFSLATFLVLLFSTVVGYSQDTNVVFDGINASVTNEPACYTSPSGIFDSTKCTANDVSFGDVYLGDHLGVLATPAYAQNPINGLFIWVKVASNSGKYDLYTQFDYLVGGVRKNFDNTPFIGGVNDRLSIRLRGTIITANSKYRLAEITNYVFGQSLELKKIYVGWESYGQSLNGRPLSGITCSGPHCTPAFYGGIIIQTPLYPDFTVVKSCDGGAFEKVVFTNTSTGGNANNTYTWLFPGALSVSPSTNPYTNFGPYTVTYASGGSKSFTLSMSNPSNLFIPNSKAGTVTVAACCNLSITNITSTNVSCFGGNNGTVTATISGAAGTAVYNLLYSVTSGGTYTNAAATNGDANGIYTGLSKGFYKVNVVDGNSCNVTSSYVEVTQPAAAVTVSGTQTNVLCNGASTGAIDLSVVGGSGSYTYLWSNGATTQDISGLAAGTYSVVITESNSCTVTGTVSFTITESALVVANAGATAELTCAVSTLVLNGSVNSEDQDGFAYSWIGPNSFTSSIRKPTISIPGTYTLTVTNADGCSASDSVVITQDITVPTAVVVNNNGLALDCNTPSTTLTASGGVSYLWSTGATTASITVSTGGIYTVTVKGANGCSATSSVTTTLDSTQPVAVIANNNGLTLDCNTTSTTLMASGGVSYLWSTGATTASIAVSKGGTFTVRVTGANGCSADASVKVTESTSATQASITGNAVLTCAVQSITLDASTTKVTGTASYLWNTGATTATIVVTTPGVYSVTVKGSTNGCSAEASVTVVQNTTPPVVTIGGNQTLTCSVSSIVLNASSTAVQGTASYLWNTGATTASITVSAAGDFSVKVTDSSNGCSATQSIKVTENYVAAQITAGSISLCIEDASLDLTTLLPTGFVSGGSWKDNNNSGGLSGSMFNPSIVNLADYSFTYSEPGDCGRIITVMVNVNDDCVVLACSTEDLVISKVVTPNGDGFNDNFEITGLEGCDFTFGVKIFNRWGKIVYQTDNYHNNWNGRHDGTGVQIGSNNELPTGTYYYIVTVSGGTGFKPITGYIYLGTH